LEFERIKLSEQQKNANKLSQLESTIKAMKSKINNLETMKDGGPSFVQLSSDVSNLKIDSFKDMARGLESSVDKPADESLAETNVEDDSDEEEEKPQKSVAKKEKGAASKKEPELVQ